MYGYYFFLGRGDWGGSRTQTLDPTFDGNVPTKILGDWGPHHTGTPLSEAPEWSSAWTLPVWRTRIDFLVDVLQADTVFLLMNGFELPYPSELFPEAVEQDHANVQDDFFQEVLNYGLSRGLRFCAMFSTTGHAQAYAAAHPECTTIDSEGVHHPTNLCHHHPQGRAYAEGVAREVLTRYHGFSGISFHPPENAKPCRCAYCEDAFTQATGRPFANATEDEIFDFYWSSCLQFQQEMETLGLSLVPGAQVYCVTIPGEFEARFPVISKAVSQDTMFLHWDYWSFEEKLETVLKSLRLFASEGHPVGFIPSAGWALDKWADRYGTCVIQQLEAVTAMGIHDILYFVGSIWHEPSLRATSLKLARQASS